jgi:hypothetical protein
MLKKVFYILTIFNLQFSICNLQSQSITWQRTYDGPFQFWDWGWDACISTNGNFFIVGETRDLNNESYAYVLKLNPYGDTLWTRLVDTLTRLEATISSGDGGLVAASGASTTKIDVNGNIIWHKRYGGGKTIYRIIRASDMGYIACGWSSTSGIEGYIFKTDSLGNLGWQRTYPAPYTRDINDITIAHDNGYILTGFADENPPDTGKVFIMKINTSGDIVWEKRYKVNNLSAVAYSINKTQNDYIIGGEVERYFFSQIFIIKVDVNGDSIFSKTYVTNKEEYFGDMKVINENKYVIGLTRDSSIQFSNGKAIITDSLGNILYDKIFPAPDQIYLNNSILPMQNGDIIFSGYTGNSNFPPYYNVYAVRTDSMLNAPPIGMKPIENGVPLNFNLHQNYPNPFNPVTKIRFDVSLQSNVSIKIYDVLGRDAAVLLNDYIKPGSYEITWHASGFASGIYLCQMMVNSKISFTKKLILIR